MGARKMKNLKISKELLSEVLGIHTIPMNPIIEPGNNIGYLVYGSQNTPEEVQRNHKQISIYEFAFKCKEWILNQKNKDCFYIADQFSLNIESQIGVIKYFWCVLLKNNSRVSPEFKGDSEIEAIIKACEFILTKRNQNENR